MKLHVLSLCSIAAADFEYADMFDFDDFQIIGGNNQAAIDYAEKLEQDIM